jgi:hypothetical protein
VPASVCEACGMLNPSDAARCRYCTHLPSHMLPPPMPPQPEWRLTGRTALVIGGAPNVRADVAKARRLRPDAVLLGANDAGALYREIEHVWTIHSECSAVFRGRALGRIEIHTACERPGMYEADWFWRDVPDYEAINSGSSGWAAGLWARHLLGCAEVILCGIGMTGDPLRHARGYRANHDHGPPTERWRHDAQRAIDLGLTEGITSMSGWSRDVLGGPR